MRTVYLAGPITGLTYEQAHEWRAPGSPFVRALKVLGWGSLSPMRNKEHLVTHTDTVMPDHFDEEDDAVLRDIRDILHCDAVIMNLLFATQISIGTVAEMGFAFGIGRPVIVVMEEHAIHDHMFVNYMASPVVHTLDEALAEIANRERMMVHG